jgi:hypothetical protein
MLVFSQANFQFLMMHPLAANSGGICDFSIASPERRPNPATDRGNSAVCGITCAWTNNSQ